MLCIIAALIIYHPLPRHERAARNAVEICEEITIRAIPFGVDPVVAVAIASEETRLQRGLKSHSGAVGPMQVLPIYWCPQVGSCNEIDAGLSAISYFLKREGGDEHKALAAYAGAGPRARKYARRVARRVAHLRGALDVVKWARAQRTSH